MPNVSIALSAEQKDFVERQVREGAFADTAAVVDAALSLLSERQAKLEALRSALEEGERSGIAEDFDAEAFLTRKRRQAMG